VLARRLVLDLERASATGAAVLADGTVEGGEVEEEVESPP
jgi:hypothetical protein